MPTPSVRDAPRSRGVIPPASGEAPPRGRHPRISTLRPNGKPGAQLDADKYEAMKSAILRVVPADERGIEFERLPEAVRAGLDDRLYGPGGPSIPWYCVAVNLDLEARGLIEEVPGTRPARLRRPPGH